MYQLFWQIKEISKEVDGHLFEILLKAAGYKDHAAAALFKDGNDGVSSNVCFRAHVLFEGQGSPVSIHTMARVLKLTMLRAGTWQIYGRKGGSIIKLCFHI